MKRLRTESHCFAARRPSQHGTSLLELLVALAIFMLISGAAFSLFEQQQKSSITLNGQVGLNLALRSTISQLQMDVVNGGNGYYTSVNIPSWPIGVTIVNTMDTSGTPCETKLAPGGALYGPNCFDELNVVVAAPDVNNPPVPGTDFPPVHTTDSSGGSSATANCTYTDSGVGYVQAASGFTLNQTKAEFKQGDQILLVKNNGNPQISTVILTADATTSGGAVKLQFTPTDGYGLTPDNPDLLDISGCHGDYKDDGSTTPSCNDLLNSGPSPRFVNSFCGTDWAVKLAPVTYQVCAGPGSPITPYRCDQTANSSDIQDPKLIRTQSGHSSIMMDQIIGFRVGGYLLNTADNCSPPLTYQYNAANYTRSCPPATPDSPFNFSLVRGVRVSLIGRTAPNTQTSYRNSFDHGPYQVQGAAVVVNPRNASMGDNGAMQ